MHEPEVEVTTHAVAVSHVNGISVRKISVVFVTHLLEKHLLVLFVIDAAVHVQTVVDDADVTAMGVSAAHTILGVVVKVADVAVIAVFLCVIILNHRVLRLMDGEL